MVSLTFYVIGKQECRCTFAKKSLLSLQKKFKNNVKTFYSYIYDRKLSSFYSTLKCLTCFISKFHKFAQLLQILPLGRPLNRPSNMQYSFVLSTSRLQHTKYLLKCLLINNSAKKFKQRIAAES